MLQIVGHLLVASRSVRDAHMEFRRYATLVEEGMTWELHEQGELASLVYVCPFPESPETRFAAECALTRVFRLGAQFVSNPDDRPVELRFTHSAPSYAQRYALIFGCPVKFSQVRNEIVFARSLLDATQLHADPTMCVVLRETADRMLRDIRGPRTMAERVRAQLYLEQDFTEIDGPRLARSLGLTYRSLRRRLAEEGVSLTSLVDEKRCRVACAELARADGSVKEIVELLGYSEPSAFYRAFRRWTGLTPSQYSRSQSLARRE
jgi:AraC-like DNA-binding protein